MNGWRMDGCIDRQEDGRTGGWIDWWMDVRMDG